MTHETQHAGIAAGQLKAFLERVERVQAEINDLNQDKSEIYSEIKSAGFDVKIVKEILKIRRKDYSERQEHDALLETYLAALGMD